VSAPIWITGVGLHGAFGGAAETHRALAENRSAVAPTEIPGASGFPAVRAAPAAPYSLLPFLPDRKLQKYMNPATELAVLSAGRALEHADLRGKIEHLSDLALFVATGLIAFDLTSVSDAAAVSKTAGELDLGKMGAEGLKKSHPLMPFKMLLNMPLGLTSIVFGIRGANFICYPGADQGGVGLEVAARGIRNGRFTRALVGGSVQGLALIPIASGIRQGRIQLGVTDPDAELPPADASAFVVLESPAAIAERGVRPLAGLGAIAQRRPPPQEPVGRARALEELWREVCGAQAPAQILIAGDLGPASRNAARALWPAEAPRLSRVDPSLGYLGAAALPTLLGLAALAIDQEPALDRILTSVHDPDGGLTAATLDRPAPEARA
jgi:3-oxoacyl-(acyl-carrier-protein) synthase